MATRGGRVRKDSYQGFYARDFVQIKKYDTNDMMYLYVPKYVRETLKKKLNNFKIENFDTYKKTSRKTIHRTRKDKSRWVVQKKRQTIQVNFMKK